MSMSTIPQTSTDSLGEKHTLTLLVVQSATRFDDAPAFLHRPVELNSQLPRAAATEEAIRCLLGDATGPLESLMIPELEAMAWFDPQAPENGVEFNEATSLAVHVERQGSDPQAEFLPLYGPVAFTHLPVGGAPGSLQPWQSLTLTMLISALHATVAPTQQK